MRWVGDRALAIQCDVTTACVTDVTLAGLRTWVGTGPNPGQNRGTRLAAFGLVTGMQDMLEYIVSIGLPYWCMPADSQALFDPGCSWCWRGSLVARLSSNGLLCGQGVTGAEQAHLTDVPGCTFAMCKALRHLYLCSKFRAMKANDVRKAFLCLLLQSFIPLRPSLTPLHMSGNQGDPLLPRAVPGRAAGHRSVGRGVGHLPLLLQGR